MKRYRTLAALVAALSLVLSVAGTTLAASQSSSASESLTINSTISLVGVPASLSYGSGLGGETRTAPQFTITATTNNPTGLSGTITASNLTSNGNSIAATQRRFLASAPNVGEGWTLDGGSTGWITAPGKAYPGSVMPWFAAAAAGSFSPKLTPSVVVPVAAVPGTYTGTLTISVSENP